MRGIEERGEDYVVHDVEMVDDFRIAITSAYLGVSRRIGVVITVREGP